MDKILKNKWFPIIAAVLIGTVALVYYIGSGKGSLDANVRSALTSPNIEKIDTTDDKKVIVKCKNGEIYQLLFDAAQQNYDDLIMNNCGEDGTMESVQ
jgi:hypothetical protein